MASMAAPCSTRGIRSTSGPARSGYQPLVPRPREHLLIGNAITEEIMQYKRISADCHLDMIWLPPDLFTSEAPQALKDRMPFVTEGPNGKEWVANNGASFRAGRRRGLGRAATMCPASSTAPTG